MASLTEQYLDHIQARLSALAARAAEVKSAWIMGGKEIETIYPHPGEAHTNTYWRYGDSSVHLPGYDIRVISPSGVITTMLLWLVNGAAADHTPA